LWDVKEEKMPVGTLYHAEVLGLGKASLLNVGENAAQGVPANTNFPMVLAVNCKIVNWLAH